MLMRNYIELAILAVIILLGLGVFFAVRRKAAKYESELQLRLKSELRGRLN